MPEGTQIDYDYAGVISGKVAAVGGRLLEGATQIVMRQFFERLARHVRKPEAPEREGFLARWLRALRALLGGGR
jgi:2-furoyl-CoA dehydrogenase large subunit